MKVTIQQTDQALTQTAGGFYASVAGGEGGAAAIDRDTVAALVVRVTDIQFLPRDQEANASDAGVWISLALSTPVELDLMALPTEGESPLVIAGGSVPVGDYGDLRLFSDNASIRFKGPIDLGAAFSFEGGVDYAVDMPSGDQTGLKTDAEFTVEADATGAANDVNLLFSPSATFLNVTATGSGRVILAPVMRSRPEGS